MDLYRWPITRVGGANGLSGHANGWMPDEEHFNQSEWVIYVMLPIGLETMRDPATFQDFGAIVATEKGKGLKLGDRVEADLGGSFNVFEIVGIRRLPANFWIGWCPSFMGPLYRG